MATLVGREAWYVQGSLQRVKIAKHDMGPPNVCEVSSISFGTHTVPTAFLKLTTEEAIRSIEWAMQYWRDQLEMLRGIQAQEADHAEH